MILITTTTSRVSIPVRNSTRTGDESWRIYQLKIHDNNVLDEVKIFVR